MSWKIYTIGNCNSDSAIAQKAAAKLTELGYSASYTSNKLSVAIDGVTYEGVTSHIGSDNAMHYLAINDTTKDLLVLPSGEKATHSGASFKYMVAFAVLSGTKIPSGEAGLFHIKNTSTSPSSISSTGDVIAPIDYVLLQQAVFVATSNNTSYCTESFVSNLYWGSSGLTTGVVITMGEDRFVCLGGWLYAKL